MIETGFINVITFIEILYLYSSTGSRNVEFQNVPSVKSNQKKKTKNKNNTHKVDGIGKDENISVMHGVGRVLNPKCMRIFSIL